MKKLLNIVSAFAIVFMVSCDTNEPLPFVEFDDLGKGAFARLIEGIDGTFNFFDVPASTLEFTVEFFDEDEGKNVTAYDWTVAYSEDLDNRVSFVNVPSSQFTDGPNGLPSVSLAFSFQQALDALGLQEGDYDGGQFFDFRATVRKSDGSAFTSDNTGVNIVASDAFNALFQIRANIICPSDLGGENFNVTTVGWCGDPFAADGDPRFNLVDEGNGVYTVEDMSFGAYDACYGPGSTLPGGTLAIVDACNTLSFSGASRWGELYEFLAMSTNGPDWTFEWLNDYGEGGTSTVTRTDGKDWPDLTF